MPESRLDYLIIGPAHPFRGGIAETQHQFALSLQKRGKKVELITFTHLYPKILFPGKTQYSKDSSPNHLHITQVLHAYNPMQWGKVAKYIQSKSPKAVIFRYYTPFLSIAYVSIAKMLPKNLKKIGFVDNWIPHEKSRFDQKLNRLFAKRMDAFSSLSSYVAKQIQVDFKAPIWEGFHPINNNLLPLMDQNKAKSNLNLESEKSYILFFGLIRKYKGLELLMRAFGEAPVSNKNIMLYVAGECYENQKKYTLLAEKLGLSDRIIFDFNFKNNTDIRQLFSAADIVAQTYITATQSGVTPLAYHYQKPLLVSDIKGLKAPIIRDQTGLVVEKKPKAIAKGIAELLEKKKYSKYVENIKKTINQYSWDSFAEQWENFISNQQKK